MGCGNSTPKNEDGADEGKGKKAKKEEKTGKGMKGGKGPQAQKSQANSLDLVARKPCDTFQLENISISKNAKKEFLEELPDEPKVVWGYRKRCKILQNCIELAKNDNTEQASNLLDTLDEGILGDGDFIIDEKAAKLLPDVKKTLKNQEGFDWPETFEIKSTMLIRHLSPPVLRGNFPLQDTGYLKYLSLSGVKLYRQKKKYFRLLTIVKRNPLITAIDLSFTGLTSIRAKDLFFYLAHMENLCCVDLRGNRLDKSCVELLNRLLSKPDMFPKLYWVDMRNNVDITHYPQSLLDQFKNRLPSGSKNMDMRDLAEGKAVIIEDEIDLAEEEEEIEEQEEVKEDNLQKSKKK